jgi:membrane-bound ClpP family serine protease
MWFVAGVLLGLVVLASLIGFHVGPHAHLAAGVLGVLAAVWLVVMAVDGRTAPVLWALLSADVIVSGGIGALAWKGLTTRGVNVPARRLVSPVGAEGVAVGDLGPEGVVRVNGEDWSAVALNGTVRAGSPVEVLRVAGVRLEVWGNDPLGAPRPDDLDAALGNAGSQSDPVALPNDSTREGGGS